VTAAAATGNRLAPGLALAAAGVLTATLLSAALGASPLVWAVAAGALLANLGLVGSRKAPGLGFAAKRLLRAGVVLLGLRLSLAEVGALGAPTLAVVAAVVGATFLGTRALARRMGLSDGLGLLVATGFAICGASAVAAMEAVADADDEEVAYAVGLVTLCGTLSILLLPPLREPLGLSLADFGRFTGASVHDVAQVVATAGAAGAESLQSAVVVKLTRVVLLAPLVALVGARRRSAAAVQGRTPVVPLFVLGFLAAVAVSSTGVVPDGALAAADVAEGLLLTAALFGLGAGVRVNRLRAIGARPLALGLASWACIAATSYVGVRLIG